ncbi:MAG: DNA-3-methyladenine glycosylase 2 family protein [Lachnospiraceae bacterium]|nr:DNA-3-methyladenine glycosylase 2 family protein [Lachnospiraceae bacterium]
MTIVNINDDFDLKKIKDSGQAFRIKETDGLYRFIYRDRILYIKEKNITKTGSGQYEISVSADEWNNVWVKYFDLNRNYESIRKSVPANDKFLQSACDNGTGLRILVQDPYEMLVTFIISQRKSIPAIKDSVERICEKYGRLTDTGLEKIYLFPTASDMAKATEAELKDCKLGYRISYIQDAAMRVSTDLLKLDELYRLNYDVLFEKLKEVRGVGDKVSNCICLFAYGKTEAAPVDTWIAKVIDKYYNGINPFPSYGKNAGIMQQFIFYYALTHKDAF